MNAYIGLMSGTSMDGIDAALVDVDTHQLIVGVTHPYTPTTRENLEKIATEKQTTLAALCQLQRTIGEEFAAAALQVIEKSQIEKKEIKAIGNHGQTIAHDASAPIPYTLQIGCSHTIAERTGITTVGDFRGRDIILGGQGAPLAPLYHKELFKSNKKALALLNIGGISNISYLLDDKASGFDIGPGNCLMDMWIQHCKAQPFDHNGDWAASGQVIPELLNKILKDPYFALKHPKSIGKEYFSLAWLSSHLKNNYQPEDIQATLLSLTAITITQSIEKNNYPISELILCGGGAHNPQLRQVLTKQLEPITVSTTQNYGVSPDFLEAMMFAWLASKVINRMEVDLRAITGSTKSQLLGCIYPV